MKDDSPIMLRRATQADVPAITALVDAAYSPWIDILGRRPGPMHFDYTRVVERDIVDLHEAGIDLVGMVQMKVEADHLLVVNVAVAPATQGRGLGRALMRHAEEIARAHDLYELRLFTNKLMVSNQRLYEQLGYLFDHEAAFGGGIVLHMKKTL